MLSAFLNSGHAVRPEDLRPGQVVIYRSLVMAAMVGSVIIFANQGNLIFAGNVAPLTWIKSAMTPCLPFCASLYGAYLAYCNALVFYEPICFRPGASRDKARAWHF